MKQILIAGIGNIFFGDDAFGCEVARDLSQRILPAEVRVIDFGIRGYDLACALTDGFDAVILVDAVSRGEPPGTTFLIEIDLQELPPAESLPPDAHSLNPVRVLQMAQTFGALPARVYLVGCEPATLETDSGELGLSEPAQMALPQAVAMIEELLRKILQKETSTNASLTLV